MRNPFKNGYGKTTVPWKWVAGIGLAIAVGVVLFLQFVMKYKVLNVVSGAITGTPTIVINPSTAKAGSTISIQGTGFKPNVPVTITFLASLVGSTPAAQAGSFQTWNVGTVTTNMIGGFTVNTTAPTINPFSNVTIAYTAVDGTGKSATANLMVPS
jgi:hypothetical protein